MKKRCFSEYQQLAIKSGITQLWGSTLWRRTIMARLLIVVVCWMIGQMLVPRDRIHRPPHPPILFKTISCVAVPQNGFFGKGTSTWCLQRLSRGVAGQVLEIYNLTTHVLSARIHIFFQTQDIPCFVYSSVILKGFVLSSICCQQSLCLTIVRAETVSEINVTCTFAFELRQ